MQKHSTNSKPAFYNVSKYSVERCSKQMFLRVDITESVINITESVINFSSATRRVLVVQSSENHKSLPAATSLR